MKASIHLRMTLVVDLPDTLDPAIASARGYRPRWGHFPPVTGPAVGSKDTPSLDNLPAWVLAARSELDELLSQYGAGAVGAHLQILRERNTEGIVD